MCEIYGWFSNVSQSRLGTAQWMHTIILVPRVECDLRGLLLSLSLLLSFKSLIAPLFSLWLSVLWSYQTLTCFWEPRSSLFLTLKGASILVASTHLKEYFWNMGLGRTRCTGDVLPLLWNHNPRQGNTGTGCFLVCHTLPELSCLR